MVRVAVVLLWAVFACAAWAVPAHAAACPDADLPYAPGVNDAQVRSGLLCLINNERLAHGLKPVVAHPALDLAAGRHLADMVARNFDGHIAPEPAPFGATPHERAAAAGYSAANGWEVGETLHSTSQPTPIDAPERTTARAAVTDWILSPSHCAVLLTNEAQHLGIGVLRSSAQPGWITDTFALVVGAPGLKMTPSSACSAITGLVAPDAVPDAPPTSTTTTGAGEPEPGVPLGASGVRLTSGATIKLNRGAAAAPLTLQCARTSGRCRLKATIRVKGRSLGWAAVDFTPGVKTRLKVPIAPSQRSRLKRRWTRATLSVQAAGKTSTRAVTLKG